VATRRLLVGREALQEAPRRQRECAACARARALAHGVPLRLCTAGTENPVLAAPGGSPRSKAGTAKGFEAPEPLDLASQTSAEFLGDGAKEEEKPRMLEMKKEAELPKHEPIANQKQNQAKVKRVEQSAMCERNDMQVDTRKESELFVLHYGFAILRSRRWLAFGANMPFCQRMCQICAQVMLSLAGWPRTSLHSVTSPLFPSEHFAQKNVDVPPLFFSGGL
ncbi:hypothetical protein PF008_g5364, partial [Phytophthora fragariae]